MNASILLVLMPLVTGAGDPPTRGQEAPADPTAIEARLDTLRSEVDGLDQRVSRLSSDIEDAADLGLVLFLFGAFCALWAKNSGRGPWLWFFTGMLFNVITVIVLLSKNARDQKATPPTGPAR